MSRQVVVTGGPRGVGAATVRSFLDLEDEVVVLDVIEGVLRPDGSDRA